jgi:hypothetical protein
MNSEEGSGALEADEIRFMQLVSMFQMAAMQQLGKLVNPITNETERNLDQARASIDLLEMLKRRTEGNRTRAESEFIDKVLFELHMNYVEETRAGGEKSAHDEDGGTQDPPDESPDTADPET